MTIAALSEAKAALRPACRERRSALGRNEREAASRAVRDALIEAMPRLRLAGGSVVAGYWPIRDELDPRLALRALRARACRIVLPAVVAKGAPLEFREWREGDALGPDLMGLEAPLPTAPALDPDVVLVPLLAFDAGGMRLGYGAGFYDRTLAALRARRRMLAIGLAYGIQEVAAIPVAPQDARLDGVVTERHMLWLDGSDELETGG